MKKAIVFGAGGFIGTHLVSRLKSEGYFVRGVDLKYPEFSTTDADEFFIGDLRDPIVVKSMVNDSFSELYQLAADMGGSEYIFGGDHDADVMHNSATINLNTAEVCKNLPIKIFYSSSACMYPEHNQLDPNNPNCEESSAYPADPDSEYGWEKLFSERLYLSYVRNYGLDVRIARFHNIFGPLSCWDNGKEKAPAAICRKVAQAKDGDTVKIIGPGTQTRSFLYIDECLDGIRRLMESDFHGPVNIGSDEMISINNFTHMIADISNKSISIENIPGPIGVNGRNSDNTLIEQKLGWRPSRPLAEGITKLYNWVEQQVEYAGNRE